MSKNQLGKNNPNWRGGKNSLICRNCGKNFKAYGDKKYCSNKCYLSIKTKNTTQRKCPVCGKLIKCTDDRIKHCSRACFDKNTELKKEIAKKGAKARIEKQGIKPFTTYRRRAIETFGLTCMKCRKDFPENKIIVHHKDFLNMDSELGNHNIDNLMVLCRPCHNKLHREYEKVHHNYFGVKDIEKGMHLILRGLKKEFGLKINDQHFLDTPKRVSRAFAEIFEGVRDTEEQVNSILSTAFEDDTDEMIIVNGIHVFSMCPHHFLPVELYMSIAYIPNGKILGISKLARLAEILARRPVVQEQLTYEITECLKKINPRGAAAYVEGQHFCMRMRGIRKSESVTVTTSVIGAFKEDQATRSEFLSLIQKGNF
jgi:GTP cyclohydrolase I